MKDLWHNKGCSKRLKTFRAGTIYLLEKDFGLHEEAITNKTSKIESSINQITTKKSKYHYFFGQVSN